MFTIACFRRDQALARLPLCPKVCRLYTFDSCVKIFTSSSSSIFIENANKVRYLSCMCLYSSTNKEVFKAEASVVIFDMCTKKICQSFNPLSRNFDIFQKSRNYAALAKNCSFIERVPEYQCQSHRRGLSQWSAADPNKQGGSSIAQYLEYKGKKIKSETIVPSNEKSGLQLFHMSSLTTTFGESYSYVANSPFNHQKQ